MIVMERNRIAVDVICQHTKDGNLIPMRIRVKDEEGEYQTYTTKEYRDVSHRGTRTTPDGVYINNNTFAFECKILVFGVKKLIRFYYQPNNTIWHMTY